MIRNPRVLPAYGEDGALIFSLSKLFVSRNIQLIVQRSFLPLKYNWIFSASWTTTTKMIQTFRSQHLDNAGTIINMLFSPGNGMKGNQEWCSVFGFGSKSKTEPTKKKKKKSNRQSSATQRLMGCFEEFFAMHATACDWRIVYRIFMYTVVYRI